MFSSVSHFFQKKIKIIDLLRLQIS